MANDGMLLDVIKFSQDRALILKEIYPIIYTSMEIRKWKTLEKLYRRGKQIVLPVGFVVAAFLCSDIPAVVGHIERMEGAGYLSELGQMACM